VPILDRGEQEVDAKTYTVTTVRGLAPRLGATSLFHLSTRGTGDGLWRFRPLLGDREHDAGLHRRGEALQTAARFIEPRWKSRNAVRPILAGDGNAG
jgi:hypothetical protein